MIRRYDLLHKGAGVNGHDVARPAEFLIDSSGTIRWISAFALAPTKSSKPPSPYNETWHGQCGVRWSCLP